MVRKRNYLSPLMKYICFYEQDILMNSGGIDGGNGFAISGYDDEDFDLLS